MERASSAVQVKQGTQVDEEEKKVKVDQGTELLRAGTFVSEHKTAELRETLPKATEPAHLIGNACGESPSTQEIGLRKGSMA